MEQMITTDDDRWRQVADRRPGGGFVYAVTTTGIYCKPGCSSRQPKRANVRFFDTGNQAEDAGFRPCKRCRPDRQRLIDPRLAAVAEACRLIEDAETPPSLDTLAEATGYSPFHLQRTFQAMVGVSPKQYADAVRAERLRRGLIAGEGVTGALYGAGYGSASRVYEKSDALLGMTPASYAQGGRGADIRFALAASPLGRVLAAATGKGLCMVSLGADDDALISELIGDFPQADIQRDDAALKSMMEAVLRHLEDGAPMAALPLDVRATAFQWQVWQALAAIPPGETRTYGELAAELGKPKAARAVGRACATNPVSLVIPCHRAVGANGSLTGYRWGKERKRALLARERGQKT
ncbi:MAG: bifunctional DNA-binding transcriptional regulator/O6-methylguanine-DNA methyltransferase Ada [Rhodospirillales bacterium]